MAKFFGISYTGINTYLTCPRQFQAKYVTKEVKFKPNVHTIKGDKLHKAMEDRISSGQALPVEWSHLEEFSKQIDAVRPAAQVFTERNLSVDRQGLTCGYRDWGARYMFGKDDLTIVKGDQARVIDYKTGKIRNNPYQLRMQAHMIFAHHEQVQTISLSFYYVEHGVITDPVRVNRGYALTDEMITDFAQYEADIAGENFPEKRNGLCKEYCDVLSCPFNGRR